MDVLTKTFDLYGASVDDLDAARALIERALQVQLIPHESMYWGGRYFRVKTEELGEIAVRCNVNTFTGGLNEGAFPDWHFIVSVSVPADPDGVKQRLLEGGLTFLKRTVVVS